MSELPLDYDERDTFVRHLDCVGVSQLVGRESPSHAGGRGRVMQVCARPTVPTAVRRLGRITHSSAPTGRPVGPRATGRADPMPSGPSDLSALPPLPRRTSTAPRVRSRSLSVSESASLTRSPARTAARSAPVRSPGRRRRGASRRRSLRPSAGRLGSSGPCFGRTASVVAGHGRGRAAAAGGIEKLRTGHPCSIPRRAFSRRAWKAAVVGDPACAEQGTGGSPVRRPDTND